MTLRNGSGHARARHRGRAGHRPIPRWTASPPRSSRSARSARGSARGDGAAELPGRQRRPHRPLRGSRGRLRRPDLGDDFDSTVHAQQVTLDLDLNVSGGPLPTSYTEGFESAGFGSFTTMTLDVGKASLALSDGHRCQYNDPDFANSNCVREHLLLSGLHQRRPTTPTTGTCTARPRRTAAAPTWGTTSLHWGVHAGAACDGHHAPEAARRHPHDQPHQPGLERRRPRAELQAPGRAHRLRLRRLRPGGNVDRGVVQVQLANSAGDGDRQLAQDLPLREPLRHAGRRHLHQLPVRPHRRREHRGRLLRPHRPQPQAGAVLHLLPRVRLLPARAPSSSSDTFDPATSTTPATGPGLQGSLRAGHLGAVQVQPRPLPRPPRPPALPGHLHRGRRPRHHGAGAALEPHRRPTTAGTSTTSG